MIPKPRVVEVHLTSKNGEYYVVNEDTLKGTYGKKLEALDASLSLSIDGASSSATIRLPIGTKLDGRTYVEMFTIQGSAGIFRARSPQIGYGSQYTSVNLEHAVNQIGDFIIDDKIEEETTLEKAMKKIFSYYKKKDQQLWKLGTVQLPVDPDNDEDGSPNCVLDVDYDNCLEAIQSVLEQYPYMRLDFNFNTIPWTLNVLNKTTKVEAEGRLSRNVKSATVTRDDSELFSRIYMDGYGKKKDRDKNNYGSYTSKWANSKYGLIETVISGANDTEAIASRVVKSYMHKHKKPRYTVTIEGIELSSITNEKLDKLTIGKLMQLALPDYNETIKEHITALSFQSIYKNPTAVTVTLSDEEDKVIKYIKKAQKSASKAGGAARKVAKEAIVKAEVSSDGKQVTLTYGDGRQVTFSKAVTLYKDKNHNAGWSNGVFWVRAYTRMNVGGTNTESELASISTSLNGVFVQDGKQPTAESATSTKLIVPVKVTHMDWGSYGDTGYHKDDFKVEAKPVYDNGWGAAYGKVVIPINKPDTNGFTLKVPTQTVGGQDSYIYYIRNKSNDNDRVEAYTTSNGSSAVVCGFYHGKYSAGWGAAQDEVVAPSAKTSGNGFTVKVPAETVGDSDSMIFYLQNQDGDNDRVQAYTDSLGSRRIVCGFYHGKYIAGRKSVDIDTPTWSSDGTGNHNTMTIKTTEPENTHSKSITFNMAHEGWSNGSDVVYTYHTNASNKIARYTVSATDLTVRSTISTASPSGKSIGSVSISQLTAGTYKVASLEYCGKQVQIYFGVNA